MSQSSKIFHLAKLCEFAILAREEFGQAIRDFPLGSTERWDLFHNVFPRYSRVGESFFDKAIAEARQGGDLAVLLPHIDVLLEALKNFCYAAVHCPQGLQTLDHISEEWLALNDAINALIPLTCEADQAMEADFDQQISEIADRVDDLVRDPALMQHFRQQIEEYGRKNAECREAQKVAEECFEKACLAIENKPRLRDKEAGPPQEGHEWRKERFFYEGEKGQPPARDREVEGWFPPMPPVPPDPWPWEPGDTAELTPENMRPAQYLLLACCHDYIFFRKCPPIITQEMAKTDYIIRDNEIASQKANSFGVNLYRTTASNTHSIESILRQHIDCLEPSCKDIIADLKPNESIKSGVTAEMTEKEWQDFLTGIAGQVSQLLSRPENRDRFREHIQAVLDAYGTWYDAVRRGLKEAAEKPELCNAKRERPGKSYELIDINEDLYEGNFADLLAGLCSNPVWIQQPPNPLDVYMPRGFFRQIFAKDDNLGIRQPSSETEALQLKYFFLAVIHANKQTCDMPILPKLPMTDAASLLWSCYGELRRIGNQLYHWAPKLKTTIEGAIEHVRADLVSCQETDVEAEEKPQDTPDTNSQLIWQVDAALFYGIPKGILSKAAKKSPSEPGYLRSGTKGRRRFYRRKDIERFSRSREKLRG